MIEWGWRKVETVLHYDADLVWDQLAADRSPCHLDPGEPGMSSGPTLLAVSAHLVGMDLVGANPAGGRVALVVNVEEALLRDK